MPFQAKLPPGGLRAAVETNLRDRDGQQTLTLAAEPEPATEQFKTVRLERQDYVGADKSAGNCPLARAIRRALRKDASVSVSVWVDKVKVGPHCYALPADATEADRSYTATGVMTESEFQLSNKKVTP